MEQSVSHDTVTQPNALRPQRYTKAARTPVDIRSLCRSWTRKSVKVLAGIMMSETAPPGVRVHAAEVLLDRGWGKPPQFTTANAEQFIRLMDLSDAELTARLEAVGVRPMHTVEQAKPDWHEPVLIEQLPLPADVPSVHEPGEDQG